MRILSLVVLVVLLNGVLGWLGNLPQDVGPDVPEGKLNSLSFAPYWEGQNPFDKMYPSSAQIDADLRLMAEKTHTIRTYASAEGNMPMIPELAKKYGIKMIQGAWLGPIEAANLKEVEELVRSANAYPDVVKRVIVGNEVLLRRDLDAQQVLKYIRMVKAKVKQPVSYADVWSMYLQHPEMVKEVDFITIHILPYWEDEPIAVDQAPAHIERIYQHVRAQVDAIAPGKAILIGESGWPSQGRQRGWSVPSVVNEAKFIRGLLNVANENGFDVNIVEAINQSWKSELEGVVGANWGLFSADRKEVFPLVGKVQENPAWLIKYAASTVVMLLGLGCGRRKLKNLQSLHALTMLLFLQVMSTLLVNQAWQLWGTSYTEWQRFVTIAVLVANAAFGMFALQRCCDLFSGAVCSEKKAPRLYGLYVLMSCFAVYRTFGLALDGRYLSFPSVQLSVIIAATLGLVLIRYSTAPRWSGNCLALNSLVGHVHDNVRQDNLLAYVMLLGGAALVVGETYAFVVAHDLITDYPDFTERLRRSLLFAITNRQLVEWLVVLGILAIPLLNNIRYDNEDMQRNLH